jgi:hypothetical protein
MAEQLGIPDPISFLEGLFPGNPFLGEPPIPRSIIDLMSEEAEASVAIEEKPKAVTRPGCTAAESTILSLGFLDGLAEGMKGFGVLRQGKEYLGSRAPGPLRAWGKLNWPAKCGASLPTCPT